jgi:hypothetical protein
MLPISAMEEGSGPIVRHNYFDVLPDEIISKIIGCLADDKKTSPESRRSFLLTCKRLDMIGQSEFINALFNKDDWRCNTLKCILLRA